MNRGNVPKRLTPTPGEYEKINAEIFVSVIRQGWRILSMTPA